MNKFFRLSAAVLFLGSSLALRGGDLTFRDAEIVIAKKATFAAETGARDLQYHLQKMTGGKFPILRTPSGKSETVIYVGDQPAAAKAGFSLKGIRKDGFIRGTAGKNVYILGDDDPITGNKSPHYIYFSTINRGTMHGVYDFLEEKGVRWPVPGKKHEFIPKQDVITVSSARKTDAPVFSERNPTKVWSFTRDNLDQSVYVQHIDEVIQWALRSRCSNIRGIASGCHTERFLGLADIWFKKYPERFQLMKNGERNPRYACWTDPAVKEIWLKAADAFFSGKKPADAGLPHVKRWAGQNVPNEFMIDPMDHGSRNDGRCRCERCNDFRKKHPCPDDSEIYWQVIAYVAAQLKDKHPGKYITTLVYPPKSRYPELVKLTPNIRVRICLGGIKDMLRPVAIRTDLEKVKTWGALVGPENLPLWTYQCENFARRLPGVPENYPHLAGEFLRTMKGRIAGIRNEFTGVTHTERALDQYVQNKLLWNPDQDVGLIVADYCRVMYGPAAKIMQDIYQRFEKNFIFYYRSVIPNKDRSHEIGLDKVVKENRIFAWTKVYTPEEMKQIGSMLAEAEKLTAGNALQTERLKAFRKWVYDVMREERKEVVDIEAMTLQLRLKRDSWTVWQNLVSADRHKNITAATKFRMKRDKEKLTLVIFADEPDAKLVRIDPKAADKDLWRDDTIELFFAFASGPIRQIVVSTSGRYTSRKIVPGKPDQWEKIEGLTISNRIWPKQRRLEINIPLTPEMQKNYRFNLVRARKLSDKREENSTWSPAAKIGNWSDPDAYGAMLIK